MNIQVQESVIEILLFMNVMLRLESTGQLVFDHLICGGGGGSDDEDDDEDIDKDYNDIHNHF